MWEIIALAVFLVLIAILLSRIGVIKLLFVISENVLIVST